jgi:hypothetical protein
MGGRTEEDFIKLVRRAEAEAASNTGYYTLKVALFALLGYLVIFAVLAGLLGLAGGVIASAFFSAALFLILLKKKLIIAVLLGIWVLLRALWVRFEPPRGHRLKRGEFPELFA